MDSLPPGQEIEITLKAGDRVECSLKETGDDDLIVVTSTGSEPKLAKSEVLLIVGEKDDDVQDGTLKGLGVGFLGGALIAAMILGTISNNEGGGWSSEATAYLFRLRGGGRWYRGFSWLQPGQIAQTRRNRGAIPSSLMAWSTLVSLV